MTRRFATLAKGLVLATAVTAFAERRAAADPLYSVTDLGAGDYTALNDRGQVIGRTNSNNDLNNQGLLYSDGKVTNLGTGFLPQGINNSGQVVGTIDPNSVSQQVGVRDQDGTLRVLGPYFGDPLYNLRINGSGQVVAGGYYETRIYSADGKSSSAYNIAPPWGTGGIRLSSVGGISDSGLVAGTASLWQDHSAVIYTGSDGLGHPLAGTEVNGSVGVGVGAVSHNGLILVGGNAIYSPETGTWTAVPMSAHDINDAGLAVGRSYQSLLSGSFPALWDGHSALNLNSMIPSASGIRIDDALAINDNGQILAIGGYTRPDDYDFSHPFDTSQHTFLLTPVNTPEPSTIVIFAAGLLALRFSRKKTQMTDL